MITAGLILQFYARIQIGSSGGSNFDFSFKVTLVETREDRNTTISGPLSARQRSAIYMAFAGVPMMAHIWRFAGVPMMVQLLKAGTLFRGSGPVLLENPIFLIFSGGGARLQ